MEQETKHSLNILSRLDSAITQLIHRVRDLSTVWVVNSLRRVLCSCLACVHVVDAILVLCVLLSLPYSCAFLVIKHCKDERLQFVEIPRKREKDYKGRKLWYSKLIIGSLERD
jgi:hypothetical protein